MLLLTIMRLGEKTKKALRIGVKVGGLALAVAGSSRLGTKGDEGATTTPEPSITRTNVPDVATAYTAPVGATTPAPRAQSIPRPSAPISRPKVIAKEVATQGAKVFVGEQSKIGATKATTRAVIHAEAQPSGANIREQQRLAEIASKARETRVVGAPKTGFFGKFKYRG